MTTLEQRIANLSPAKRALLEQHLKQQAAQGVGQQPIPARIASGPCPLSFSQQRLWFIQQVEPENRAFHNAMVWRLTGTLDKDALTRSLAEIVGRHAPLRTRIVVQDGEPVQLIDPVAPFRLPFSDFRPLSAAQQEDQLDALRHELQQRAYDFAVEHPWRFQLVQLQEQEHVLIIAKHHIATDGWSNGVFQRELSQLYTAFGQGQPSSLAPLPLDYADFAIWQRAQLQGARLAEQLAYWSHQLQKPPVLQLPTDYPRAATQPAAAATHDFVLAPLLTASLKALSKAQGVTLYMTLVAAFKILLFRYTGQQDINVGAPIAGRSRAEVEGLIGFFLNTLVLRSQLNPAAAFLDLLAQVRCTTLDAYSHQDVPIEKLIEVLQPDRTQANSPLFQVLFLLQNMPRHPLNLPGLQITRLTDTPEAATADLSCTLREEGDQISGEFTYRSDLFRPATITRLAGHYQTLLASIVADPTCPIATLPMLTDTDRQQLLVEWNQTQVAHPLDKSLVELFAKQVAQRPATTAFLTEDATLTYAELNQRTDQLAAALRSASVEKGTIVGVCLPRSFDAVVALLAIFKVGGIYLPLDPAYPSERLAFMLTDAQAPFVITNTHLQPTLPATTAKLIYLDTRVSLSPHLPISLSPCLPTDPAYIIYTSGSTGQPKGALVPHRQILNRLWWMWRKYPFQPDEMSCQKTALNFVDSLWELLGPLLQGSPTVILPDEIVRDPQRLIQSLARHGVTRLWLVPTLLRLMLQTEPNLGALLPKLRFLVASGEALPTELFQQTQAKLPQATLYNLYGTSEVWDATWYDPTACPMENHTAATIPIGKPIDNVQTYILDAQQQPVPIGVTGELYVGGVGLADGYLNRPELTAEKFIDLGLKNLSTTHNSKLYKTGDLARYLPDGNLEFMGRADFQVKLRGFRIELSEIEAVLNQHPSIDMSAVVVHKNEGGNQQLAAYLVAASGDEIASSLLFQYLKDRLPTPQIPATYTWLPALPLTPSGKIDRQALPLPTPDRAMGAQPATAARDALEMQLVQIWEKTLGVQPVGIHDNFFHMGGHSLLAIMLFDRIAKLTGKTLPLGVLFQSPTIAHLATLLRQQNWQPAWRSLVPVQPAGHKPPLFLAPPAASTVLRFANITRHLPADQPVYGLAYLGMDGENKPHDSIEAMADYYLAEIRKLQPNPPYLLAGICFGSHLMLEVAQQLVAQGQPVALLAVLDAGPPANGPTWRYRTPPPRFSAEHFQVVYDYWREEGVMAWVRGHLKHRINYVRKLLYPQQRLHPEQQHFAAVRLAHNRANMSYQANTYPGRICLIQSEEYAHWEAKYGRWQALAQGGFADSVIAGSTHQTVLFQEPYTRLLAKQLTAALTRVIEVEP